MVNTERRRFPRVADEGLSLSLNAETITHTLNISASGVYCKVDKELPLMSGVTVKLALPDPTGEGRAAKPIEVHGVVVRQHPVIIDDKIKHYDVAIFFDDLSEKNSSAISDYIARKKS